eukprot:CAMPEP_0173102960 /NCGR_PEP_ID=MMETSP1102-20130122/38000_1 /TAXON_ID=49646 /ORGANISM="Geminigera sp., Strain Caron Lab Isolate" /LENGTH=51 /DNA_ID=CAMNT_0013997473 /DNA_START=669 /DNA_END=820 /DNA_ORIENTATION=-
MTSDVLDIVNNVFTGMFLVEMLLKMLGLGRTEYFNDNYNCFDFLVTFISVV